MAVPIENVEDGSIRFRQADVVLQTNFLRDPAHVRTYDVSPDGTRFLMIREDESGGVNDAELIYVQNWLEELKRLVPVQ